MKFIQATEPALEITEITPESNTTTTTTTVSKVTRTTEETEGPLVEEPIETGDSPHSEQVCVVQNNNACKGLLGTFNNGETTTQKRIKTFIVEFFSRNIFSVLSGPNLQTQVYLF